MWGSAHMGTALTSSAEFFIDIIVKISPIFLSADLDYLVIQPGTEVRGVT